MNTQQNTTLGYASRTFVGISMMALAMVSFTACGSKSSGSTNDNGGGTGNANTTIGDTNQMGNTNQTVDSNSTNGNTTAANSNGITGNSNGVQVTLGYAVLSINANATTPSKMYALNFLDYNPYCFYAQNPDPNYSTYPNTFNAMAVYLTNGTAAPVVGAYTLGGTTAIDPSSGFEAVTNCVAPGSTFSTGSTVTLTAIDTTAKTASGSVTVNLANGGTFSGSFTTVSSCPAGTTTPAAVTPLCTNTSIVYK